MVSRIGACGRRRKKGESVEVPAALRGRGPSGFGAASVSSDTVVVRRLARGTSSKMLAPVTRALSVLPARRQASDPGANPGRPAPEPIGCGFESRLRPEGCVDSAQTQFS